MPEKLKGFLAAVLVVMVFTAQTNRPAEKTGAPGHAQASHAPAPRPAGTSHVQNRPAQRQAPIQASRIQSSPAAQPPKTSKQVFYHDQNTPVVQFHQESSSTPAVRNTPHVTHVGGRPEEALNQQPAPSPWTESHVYAAPSAPASGDNRLFHRHHRNNWQPRYNFYDNQYHFYPYVDISTLVELTSTSVLIPFGGQNYCYDQGTFYLPDPSGEYVAVAPPLGIMVSALPSDARQINVNGQIYYRYKGVFYLQVAQGYEVIGPVEPVAA